MSQWHFRKRNNLKENVKKLKHLDYLEGVYHYVHYYEDTLQPKYNPASKQCQVAISV